MFHSRFLFNLATEVNRRITQPAYRAKMLHQIEKEQKKEEKCAAKHSHRREPTL